MFVQFEDETKENIVSVFDSVQSASTFPYQGVVDEDDARYIAFVKPATPAAVIDPVDKLKAFIDENPDVANILK